MTFEATPDNSELEGTDSLSEIYDKIRMVDGDDYPRAFLLWENLRLEFVRATFVGDEIEAKVKIARNEN